MHTNFYRLVKKSTVYSNSQIISHVSIGQTDSHPQGRFFVDDEDEFYELYKNEVAAGCELNIAERFRNEFPLVVDVDLKRDCSEGGGPLYTMDDMETVIRAIQKVLTDNFYFENDDVTNLLRCLLLTKMPYVTRDAKVKHGFHLHFPDFTMTPEDYELYQCKLTEALSGVGINGQGVAEFMDFNVVKNNWLMYGSSKPGLKPYRVESVYDGNMNIVDIPQNLHSLLSVRNTLGKPALCKIQQTEKIRYIEKRVYVNDRYDDPDDYSEYVDDECDDDGDHKQKGKRRVYKKNLNPERVGVLVDLLDPARSDAYQTWDGVGFILSSLGEAYRGVWHKFSSLSKKYDEDECDKKWDHGLKGNCYGSKLTLGSLIHWAKEDNLDGFRAWSRGEHTIALASRALLSHPNTTIVNQKLFDIKPYTEDVVFIKSNVASGKSLALYALAKEMVINVPDCRIAIVTPRISLAKEVMSKLGSLGFEDYQDIEDDITDNRVVIQVDSLERIYTDKKFDLILLMR